MNLKEELLYELKEIREEVGGIVKVSYSNQTSGSVKAIVYNRDVVVTGNIIESRLVVNILKQDLIDNGLAIKGFTEVTWNRVKYVPVLRPLSNWETVIVLECKILS